MKYKKNTDEIVNLKNQYAELYLLVKTSKEKNTSKLSSLRKEIARKYTQQNIDRRLESERKK